jgi:hypothetical protein
VVFMVAEVMPVIQQKMNEAIAQGYRAANRSAEKPATPATALRPTAAAAPSSALATASRLRLPDSIVTAVKAKAAEVAQDGRALTIDDVRATVRVSTDMAEQIVKEVTANNGHAFAH